MTLTAPRKGSKRSEQPRPKGVLALAAAYSHPTRVRILNVMSATNRRCSPTVLAEEWGEDVRNVAYHFRELVAFGLLEIVEKKPKRGSVENIHETTKRAVAWADEWGKLPPIFKQHLSALPLRLGVESVGAAIDAGTFESRDDVVIAQDTMRLDEASADEVLSVLKETLDRLMAIGNTARTRLAETGEEGVLISYLMVGFEGSIERPS
ncbi:MAG TPA: helix-turn-helix domain-containing protein [Solirubrobacterales bacterium]|jgi:DNA-binding transcriptional ArsR family regulator